MSTKRAYVFESERATKTLMAVECTRISASEAKVPAHIKLGSLKPGMIFCIGAGDREADRTTARKIERVDQKKTGLSTIHFVVPPPPRRPSGETKT